MLPLIDRYIVKNFLYFFTFAFTLLLFIYVLADFIIFYATYNDVSIGVFARYYFYASLEIAYRVLPLSCLFGCFMTFSQIHKNNELIVLLSSGRSFFRIYSPVLILVFSICFAGLFISNQVLPWAIQNLKYVKYVEIKKTPHLYSTVKTDKIWYRSENKLFYIKTLNIEDKTAEDLHLYYFNSNWDLQSLVRARSVDITSRMWKLSHGNEIFFGNAEKKLPSEKSFKSRIIDMGEQALSVDSIETSSDVVSLGDLIKFIRKNKKVGLDILNYQADLYFKISSAFNGFFLVLLSLPFAVSRKQRQIASTKNLLLSLSVFVAYWTFSYWCLSLAKQGSINLFIASWLTPFIFSVLAVRLLMKMRI